MNTVRTHRQTTDDTRRRERARIELTWTLQHTRGRAPALVGRWTVVEPGAVDRAAA